MTINITFLESCILVNIITIFLCVISMLRGIQRNNIGSTILSGSLIVINLYCLYIYILRFLTL